MADTDAKKAEYRKKPGSKHKPHLEKNATALKEGKSFVCVGAAAVFIKLLKTEAFSNVG